MNNINKIGKSREKLIKSAIKEGNFLKVSIKRLMHSSNTLEADLNKARTKQIQSLNKVLDDLAFVSKEYKIVPK